MHDSDLVVRASGFHPWDAMAPAALCGILKRAPFRSSVETGCGGSTIVLSNASDRHIAFSIEGKDRTISELRRNGSLRTDNVTFVEGETRFTLPVRQFDANWIWCSWTGRTPIRCRKSSRVSVSADQDWRMAGRG